MTNVPIAKKNGMGIDSGFDRTRSNLHIGITYDLREAYIAAGYSSEATAEFDSSETIKRLASAIQRLGAKVERVGNVRQLAARLVAGARWDLVFNIAEGLNGPARESQVPALLDSYGIPYTFSDPLVLGLTLHKGIAKTLVRDYGVRTALFLVAETEKDLSRSLPPYPHFVKPVSEGSSKGVDVRSRVCTHDALIATCRRLWQRFNQPVLIEAYLPGREFTVGILGTGEKAELLGVIEVELNTRAEPHSYSYEKSGFSDRALGTTLLTTQRLRRLRRLLWWLGAHSAVEIAAV